MRWGGSLKSLGASLLGTISSMKGDGEKDLILPRGTQEQQGKGKSGFGAAVGKKGKQQKGSRKKS